VRVDAHILLERAHAEGEAVPRAPELGRHRQRGFDLVTAIGAGTTYPDYKPAPFIVASELRVST
jgi:hypothetical protein